MALVCRDRKVATYSDVRSTGLGWSMAMTTVTGAPAPRGGPAAAGPLLPQDARNGTSDDTRTVSTNTPRAFGSGRRKEFMRNCKPTLSAYCVPVWPKPPAPRMVAGSSSTSDHVTRGTGATRSCAIRMPRSTTKGASPRLTSATMTSPR